MAKTVVPDQVDDSTPVEVSPSYGSASRIYAGVAQSNGGEVDPAAVVVESEN